MPEAVFHVSYGGDGLARGSMDVRDLAPALLAVADSCTRANELLNGTDCRVSVRVEAEFRRGSFTVGLALLQLVSANSTAAFVAQANDILRLLGYVKTGTLGALGIIKSLRGQKPTNVTPLPNGMVSYTFNNCTFNVPAGALQLATDPVIREHLAKTMAPLEREDIDSFSCGDQDGEEETVGRADLASFTVPDIRDEPPYLESEAIVALQIITPQFDRGLKWRLGNDSMRLTATMDDKKFEERINSGCRFGKGDILKVRIKTSAWRTAAGLTTDNAIVEVLDHVERAGPPPRIPGID